MGWDSCSAWKTKKHVVDDVKGQLQRGGSTILKEKCTNDGAWFAIDNDGRKYIYFALINKYRGEYCLKTMSESAGPSYYSCPVSFFKIVPLEANDGYAKEWREKVLVYDQRVKFRPTMGMRFELYGKEYTITDLKQVRTTKRWIARDDEGNTFYLKASQYMDMNPIIETVKEIA